MKRAATYHVHVISLDKYLGESGRYVADVMHALIHSRDGAIHAARTLNAQGADAVPVMLTAGGTVRRVHERNAEA